MPQMRPQLQPKKKQERHAKMHRSADSARTYSAARLPPQQGRPARRWRRLTCHDLPLQQALPPSKPSLERTAQLAGAQEPACSCCRSLRPRSQTLPAFDLARTFCFRNGCKTANRLLSAPRMSCNTYCFASFRHSLHASDYTPSDQFRAFRTNPTAFPRSQKSYFSACGLSAPPSHEKMPPRPSTLIGLHVLR